MITVKIEINGRVIYCRSAVNITPFIIKLSDDTKNNVYKNDDGTTIKHKPKDGAIKLAKKMLDTIVEV